MISNDKVQISVIIAKKYLEKLEKDAFWEDRSISNMAAVVIKRYYKNKDLKSIE